MTAARTRGPAESEVVLGPDAWHVALAGPVRVVLGTSRSPGWLLVRLEGSPLWAVFGTCRRQRTSSPIVARVDRPARVKAFAWTTWPPLCHSPGVTPP